MAVSYHLIIAMCQLTPRSQKEHGAIKITWPEEGITVDNKGAHSNDQGCCSITPQPHNVATMTLASMNSMSCGQWSPATDGDNKSDTKFEGMSVGAHNNNNNNNNNAVAPIAPFLS